MYIGHIHRGVAKQITSQPIIWKLCYIATLTNYKLHNLSLEGWVWGGCSPIQAVWVCATWTVHLRNPCALHSDLYQSAVRCVSGYEVFESPFYNT